MKLIKIIGIIGFILSLVIMYMPNHGIANIRNYYEEFSLLDMQFGYDNNTVFETMSSIGKGGRSAYLDYLILDFFFIFCFLIVMLTITSIMRVNEYYKLIMIIPSIFRAIFDILENTILLKIITEFPSYNNNLATWCSYFTKIKFVMLYLWLILFVINLLFSLYSKYKMT